MSGHLWLRVRAETDSQMGRKALAGGLEMFLNRIVVMDVQLSEVTKNHTHNR